MKASELVLQLAKNLPRFTDLFTVNADLISLTMSGTTVTGTTSAPHAFTTGRSINITGATTPILIDTFTRVGNIGTIITLAKHDFTFGTRALSGEGQDNVITQGANESEFNGSFVITGIPDRNNIVVEMDDSGATTATGSPQADNANSVLNTYNGIFSITSTPTPTTFTYELPDNPDLLPAAGTPLARSDPRISSAITLERIIEAYTEKPNDELWGFIVLADTFASKNRDIKSDATDNIQRTEFFRQQIQQQVSFFVVIPSTNTIAGRQSRDQAEELLKPVCQSMLMFTPDSLVSTGKLNPLQFISHGFSAYNSAFYIHQYVFELSIDLSFGDTIGFDEDVAFRDIDLSQGVDVGTGVINTEINLDETLP